MKAAVIVGWDIGGAHVKAALRNTDGDIAQIFLKPCPLWQGLSYLEAAVTAVMIDLPLTPMIHVMTMTGELVDLFPSREAGVAQIIACMRDLLLEQDLYVFAGREGFLAAEDVTVAETMAIASANWLATADWLAAKLDSGLLVDIGSTTTDILLFQQQQVMALGYSDYERLASQELIYTGVIRSAVMAVAQQAFFKGRLQGLMTEYFATMADVYRVTGELNEVHDLSATADGAEKTKEASARRLSRLVGYDFQTEDVQLWLQFAQYLRAQQLQVIEVGVRRQLSRNLLSSNSLLIGAGIGRFLVRDLALRLGARYCDFDDLVKRTRGDFDFKPSDCAPAVALALLFQTERIKPS